MNLKFCLTILLAVSAIACTHTDPTATKSIRLASNEAPSCGKTTAPQTQSDACSAKTMAGQRPYSYR
jgi:hypothetical protein